MKVDFRKIAIAAIPLAVGGVILFGLGRLQDPKKETPATGVPAVDGSTPAPQDATHEKAALEQELQKKPGHPPILFRLAEMEREGGHADKAASYLREILQQDPVNEDARLELGRALFEANDIDGAIKETERLVKDHPKNADGLYNLGAIYANLNRNDLARDYWTKAVAAAPESDSGRRAQESLAKIEK